MALTERQQQITDLLDQGKTPAQIAKALKITENAVYQHVRRIKQSNGSASKPRRKATTRKTARKTTRKPARKTPRARPKLPTVAELDAASEARLRAVTPLQAIRARRDEIKQSVKHLADAMQEAERAAKAAAEAHDKALSKHNDELGQLDRAEEALTGKSRAKPRRQSSRKAPAKPAEEAPAPAQAPAPAAEAPPAPENGSAAPVNDATPAVRDDNGNVTDSQAALDAGAEFEDIAQETPQAEPVGVVEEGGFEQQPDDFGDE